MQQLFNKQIRRNHRSLALAACIVFTLSGTVSYAQPLDLAQSPPGTIEPYVAPNVLITFDDSGSMNYWFDNTNAPNRTSTGVIRNGPVNGTWPNDTRRISVLKYSVTQVFSDPSLVENGKIRLAWQAMHNNGNYNKNYFPGANDINNSGLHNMRILDNAHRSNFLDYVSNMSAGSGTPTHKVAYQAHKYMSATDTDKYSPWASKPGQEAQPFLGCRRSYHILMSDGGWQTSPQGDENPGNVDGTTATLPDGTVYNATYPYADTHSNMVADWAFKSWSTKLRNDLDGELKPIMNCNEDPKSFGFDTSDTEAKLSCYWNPLNNPATWPHMVTYTIGISKDATRWPGEPNIYRPDEIVPFGYQSGGNGSLPDLITGKIKWPKLTTGTEHTKNPLDLWHSAINGRGRYYAVEKGDDLVKAFREIIGKINTDNETKTTSLVTDSTTATRSNVGGFVSSYDPKNHWSGKIESRIIDESGDQTSGWGGQDTAEILDAMNLNNRVVLSWNDGTEGAGTEGGIPFDWGSLSERQKVWLGKGDGRLTGVGTSDSTGADGLGQDRLQYLRGNRSKEGTADPASYDTAHPFRERGSRQGDIVNSDIWYVAGPVSGYAIGGYNEFVNQKRNRSAMLYVGGNDGMLHGFTADEGEEKIAYVPKGVVPTLHHLSDSEYEHRYYVDGSPFSGDVKVAAPNSAASWRTYLVGTLGAGGKGYFVLNITDPGDFSESNADPVVVLDQTWSTKDKFDPACGNAPDWEYFPATITICEDAKDIGHIFATPVVDPKNNTRSGQVVQLNNGRWAAIMGNGYNSENERPVLLVQYLDEDKELLRIPVTGTSYQGGNGLSAPRPVDIDGDGKMDIVYAGDLQGNLWKFDVTSQTASNWKVAFNGEPLYTIDRPDLVSGDEASEFIPSITGAPVTRANNRGVTGLMVAFGSGRNLTIDDWNNTSVQTLYAVLDNSQYELNTGGEHIHIHCESGGGASCDGNTPETVQPGLAQLWKQTIGTGQQGSDGLATHTFWALDDPTDDPNATQEEIDAATIDWKTQKGWYLDLPETGERLLKNLSFHDGSNILLALTQVPATQTGESTSDPTVESCDIIVAGNELQYITLLNIMDGRRPGMQIVDMNDDGLYTADDDHVSRMTTDPGSVSPVDILGKQGKPVKKVGPHEVRKPPRMALRPNWRQLQ